MRHDTAKKWRTARVIGSSEEGKARAPSGTRILSKCGVAAHVFTPWTQTYGAPKAMDRRTAAGTPV
ncbi:MAG TPA: hypothetical protein VHG08_03925 [Longimicrobium sp.]|nr:hypothetical protein [Longimicrobium sp.]